MATPMSFSVLGVEGYLRLGHVGYGEKLHGSETIRGSCFVYPTISLPTINIKH